MSDKTEISYVKLLNFFKKILQLSLGNRLGFLKGQSERVLAHVNFATGDPGVLSS